MPKLKTHKGASKRFKKTGTGKVVRSHAFGRHILTSKPHKRTRLSEAQKNALKSAITGVLGGNKEGLNRNEIAKAISR